MHKGVIHIWSNLVFIHYWVHPKKLSILSIDTCAEKPFFNPLLIQAKFASGAFGAHGPPLSGQFQGRGGGGGGGGGSRRKGSGAGEPPRAPAPKQQRCRCSQSRRSTYHKRRTPHRSEKRRTPLPQSDKAHGSQSGGGHAPMLRMRLPRNGEGVRKRDTRTCPKQVVALAPKRQGPLPLSSPRPGVPKVGKVLVATWQRHSIAEPAQDRAPKRRKLHPQ